MTRTVLVADEVAALIGPEQANRLRGPEWSQPVTCWTCDQTISADETAAVVLLLVPEWDDPDTGAGLSYVVLTHPQCQPSQVLTVRQDEINVLGDNVTAVATVLHTSRDSAFPVVMVSYDSELIAQDPQSDRVDLVSTWMLEHGWHPITTLAQPPAPGPDGWHLRFTHHERHATAPGRLQWIDPTGDVITEAHVQPNALWRPAVIRTGQTAVLQGSRFLTHWADDGLAVVTRAIRAGLLTGGLVPVDLAGPGNTDKPGSVYP